MLGIRTALSRLALPRHLRAVSSCDGMISLKEADLLYLLATEAKAGCIVEVGSYRGRSAVALALGSKAGRGMPVYAVEPHEPFRGALGGEFGPADRAAFYRAMLRTGCYHTVRLVNLSSEQAAAAWALPVSLLFLDGDHTYPGVSRDWRCWESHLAPGAVVVFDDATKPELGPWQLLRELTASGWEEKAGAGKMRVIKRKGEQSGKS
jgi:predicted O-methyltransferase YrrM